MDSWSQDQHRHKRTFQEMSEPTSFTPPPFFLNTQPNAMAEDNRSLYPPMSSPILQHQFERRRTSHPHNEASQTSQASQTNLMAEPRSQPPRPNLEHRTSQTIIDLTEDSSPAPIPNARVLQSRPHLDRSDAWLLGDVIDLTDDAGEADAVEDDDIQIVSSRPASVRPGRQSAQELLQRRAEQVRQAARPIFRDGMPIMVPEDDDEDDRASLHDIARAELLGRVARLRAQIPIIQAQQLELMIGGRFELDYQHHPFHQRQRPPLKPQHEPPPDAKEGFTRSPKEEDVVICPACEMELVARKDQTEPTAVKKPGGRAPTKKDREEHPFWVVRDCGHVYCNACYQHRKVDKKHTSNFPQGTTGTGKQHPICAVEGCEQDVGDKKHWVGVFI